MKIYESKFKTTVYSESESLISNYWTNEEMQDADFQHEITVWIEAIEELTPLRLLADTRLFNYAITVDMQEWNNNTTFPRIIAAGVKKFAIIMPADLLIQLSLQQTMEEDKTGAFAYNYFDNEDSARAWLLK